MKNSKWQAGLTDQEKQDLKASMLAATPAFKRLTKLLDKKLEENESRREARDTYDKAAWPYFQADCSGYNRAIKEIIKLIEVD